MFTSRFARTLFCSAALLAATIVPASSKTNAASKPRAHRAPRNVQQLLPANTKMRCYDTGSMSRCCTDSNYCCTWYGSGSPICY